MIIYQTIKLVAGIFIAQFSYAFNTYQNKSGENFGKAKTYGDISISDVNFKKFALEHVIVYSEKTDAKEYGIKHFGFLDLKKERVRPCKSVMGRFEKSTKRSWETNEVYWN